MHAPDDAGSRLAPCPDSPDCVSGLAASGRHAIAPLPPRGSTERTIECLRTIVAGMKRTYPVRQEQDCLHAEFRSIMGFVDDVVFVIDRTRNVVQMRSASRVGYWDFGVSRRRPEQIRAAIESINQTGVP